MIKWLIVDGYNLIHRPGGLWPGSRQGAVPLLASMPRDLEGKRRDLVQLLERTAGVLAERITVVFDGRSGNAGGEQASAVVEELFSAGDKTADTVIEQLVFQAGTEGGIVVVTSDRLERETAEGAGARTMACSVFLEQLSETLDRLEQDLRRRNAAQHPAAPLGNPFAGLDINKPGETT